MTAQEKRTKSVYPKRRLQREYSTKPPPLDPKIKSFHSINIKHLSVDITPTRRHLHGGSNTHKRQYRPIWSTRSGFSPEMIYQTPENPLQNSISTCLFHDLNVAIAHQS